MVDYTVEGLCNRFDFDIEKLNSSGFSLNTILVSSTIYQFMYDAVVEANGGEVLEDGIVYKTLKVMPDFKLDDDIINYLEEDLKLMNRNGANK